MSDTEYTPTTEEVMRGFTALQYKINPQRDDEDFAGWLSRMSKEAMTQQMLEEAAARRWLRKHDADVWDESCKALAWCMDNGATSLEDAVAYVTAKNPYREDTK
jgi:predicted HD phosphohydrolase